MNCNVLYVIVGAIVVATTPAVAQGINAEQACSNDAYRLCERFIPDRDKTGACLRKNKRLLSPDCRIIFSGGKSRRR
jgi:hypothetical protein